MVAWERARADRETEDQQCGQTSYCSRRTVGPEQMIAAARLDAAVHSGHKVLQEAQTEVGLQTKEGSEEDLQMTVGFEAEGALNPLYWFVVRLVGH